MIEEDRAWHILAEVNRLRGETRHVEAIALIGPAADDDPRLAATRAMLAFEAWLPATAWLQRAVELNPNDPSLVKTLAMSLMADGDFVRGEAVLIAQLAITPAWIDGQNTLARARTTHGSAEADRGYELAVADGGAAPALWLAWLHWAAKSRDWAKARDILGRARAVDANHRGLALSDLFIEAESGASRDPRLFDSVAGLGDMGTDLARVRHALRLGEPGAVEAIAAPHLGRAEGRIFWPYLSLGWRLLGDERAEWLERPGGAVGSYALDYSSDALAALAAFVRTLHVTSAPQIDQSVRSGTQTERSIMLHHDSRIAELRARLTRAIDRHVAAMPDAVAGHPWLGSERSSRRIAGSWSVRLGPDGHHVPHTHPHGWLSSALHLELPAASEGGALLFGTPPPELGLELAPIRRVEPIAGSLQLFPSTAWHSTMPIASGERLTLAFDVALPAS